MQYPNLAKACEDIYRTAEIKRISDFSNEQSLPERVRRAKPSVTWQLITYLLKADHISQALKAYIQTDKEIRDLLLPYIHEYESVKHEAKCAFEINLMFTQ